MIAMMIYSNDYLKYTYCRKHFRLSGAITKLRLRMNEGYLPLEGIQGNAAKPFPTTTDGVDN
jgi:hypothetical protein